MVEEGEISKYCYSGPLKLFEKGKSCKAWTEYWAVTGLESLRLFTNHESFLNDLEEAKLIQLTARTICQNVRKTNQDYQFKVCNDDTMYSFKCESESTKEHWLGTLGAILSTFCRKSCFHCNERSENGCPSVRSNSGNADNSSESSTGSLHSRTDESTFISPSTNISRHSTGSDDQITKSPLKIYDSEQSVFSSFNKAKKPRSEMEDVAVNADCVKSSQSTQQAGQAMKNEKSTAITKNSFGYTFETDSSADHVSSSSLKLFERENKRFSTFFTRSGLKREHPIKEFANPAFVLDDGDFTPECPEIPKRISNVFDAPLNYDVPSLSKNDPSRGYLKVLTGRNNWKKCQAAVVMNVLFLSDPEENSPVPENVTRIELKPNIKFTILPRRSNDYRFKMTSGTSEYFFKTSNVQQRDFWIKVLTNATSCVCQNTCPRCCTSATRNVPNWADSDLNLSSEVDTNESADTGDQNEDTDDVFYVGMANPNEGLTFVNSVAGEIGRDDSASVEATVDFPEADQVDNQKPSYLRSGYLKTNAIENNWGQYWAVTSRKQLVLHSSEDNLNELKTIQLSHNVQCKTAKRSSYDFRFTLTASAVESYEFKCASAHDRREWMTSLERSGRGGAAQGLNAGSRISEIVTQIRENKSRMEEITKQKRLEEMKEKQRKEELRKQQEDQQQQINIDGSQDIYDDISSDCNVLPQLPALEQQLPPATPPETQERHRQPEQQQQKNIDCCQDIYDDICLDSNIVIQQVPPVPQQLPPPKPPKNREQLQQQRQQDIEGGQDIYDDTFSSNLPQQQQLPPIPQQAPPTPPQSREQHNQLQQDIEGGQDIYDDTCVEEIPEQNLPPVPQQQPPPTPPEKQQAQQETQQDLYEMIPADEQTTDEGGKDLYEVIPADNNQQQSQQEELYELIPADQVEQCEQKQPQKKKQKEKKKKEKKIVPALPKKQQKKDKKQRKDKQSPEPEKEQEREQENNKNQQNQITQALSEKQSEDTTKHKVEEKEMSKNLEDKMEDQTQKLSLDFEQHVKLFQEVKPEESSSSAESKEELDVGLRLETESIVDVIEEKSSEVISPGNETMSTEMRSGIQVPYNPQKSFKPGSYSITNVSETSKTLKERLISSLKQNMEEIKVFLKDVERFLTQVLGHLTNLPDDVNKERLELAQRLQKLINLPKDESKRRPPPPQPVEPVEEVDEDDEGTYGDVALPPEDLGQETYDDVVKENPEEVQEDYEDIIGMHQKVENALEPEELYDDVNTPDVTSAPKVSKISNNSENLDTKNVAEPKKASDIRDKVYEGVLDKYKTKGFMKSLTSKWQRRFCVLTPLALYYYENQKDQKQKGQIFLPSSGTTLRKGCPSFTDVKDGKMCFELQCNDRCYLFKVLKESERDIWVLHVEAALQTDLSDEQSKIMKQTSSKMSGHDDDDVDAGDNEDLYETVDTFKQVSKETPGSLKEAPALPSRAKPSSDEPDVEEEEFDEIMEDYELPEVNAPKPGSAGKEKQEERPPPVANRQNQRGSPTLPPRPSSSQEAPNLPPRSDKSPADPPELPSRTTPPTQKKAPPELPIRTTPTLAKKILSAPAGEREPPPPAEEEPEVKPKPEVTPPLKTKPTGEQFDYGKVYVAMWNCQADDEEDLAFSRGNYLYIREKIPNSDWWVASLMDIPDIRVGLVPRNYIMPAYEM